MENEILKEVIHEIESALKDSLGITSHQRRLAFSLSLESVTLLEDYLKKSNVLKPGAKINHLWLKKKKENAKKLISNQITINIEELKEIDKILNIVYKIEKERNELAYGKIVSETILKNQINLFLDLKKIIENV